MQFCISLFYFISLQQQQQHQWSYNSIDFSHMIQLCLLIIHFIEISIYFHLVWRSLDIFFFVNNRYNHMWIWMNYWKKRWRYFWSIIFQFLFNHFIWFYIIYLSMNEWMIFISIFTYTFYESISYFQKIFLHIIFSLKILCSLPQHISSCRTTMNKLCQVEIGSMK